jgi:ankyrin repeat protein
MSVDPRTQSLFDAIAATNYSQVKRAIDLGVSVNSQNERGQTPLAVACKQGNLEIVDLLVASGAQMQVQSIPQSLSVGGVSANRAPVEQVVPVLGDWDFQSILFESDSANESELPESPVRDREIAYEDLIELIHQPAANSATEVEQLVPIGGNVAKERLGQRVLDPGISSVSAPTAGQNLNSMAAAWPQESDPEATYTYDLDEVFAANEKPTTSVDLPAAKLSNADGMFDEELTMTSLERPASGLGWEASATYAFDLGADLDRLTSDEQEDPDRLMQVGEWEEGETYAIDDLDHFGGVVNRAEIAIDLTSREDDSSNLDRTIDTSKWEEGETYAIDLDEIDAHSIDFDLTGGNRIEEIDPSKWEEGETYAIDLGEIGNPYQFTAEMNLGIDSPHMLGDFDATFLPAIGGDDGADFDPDTQTSTDIHGHGQTDTEDEVDSAPFYDENATNTSLMAAVIAGDLDLAGQAVEARASLDRYDWNLGYSPLGMAIDRGHADLVQFLLDQGANPQAGSLTTTALGLAAERGEAEIIQMLLPRGIDVNEPVGQDGWTALLAAIKHGHRSVVQLLVTAGAKVNIWSRGETPILLAAKCEEREIYNYLYPLVNTALRLCADRDGEQLLQTTRKRRIREQNRPVEKFIEVATAGNVHEVNRALEFGIEIDAIGAQGHTALMAAAYYGHRSVMKILLAAGADPNILSDGYEGLGYGMTALMFAAGSFFASDRQMVAKQLVAAGADVNQQGAGGKTAIVYAALAGSGYRTCVETLIAAGADLDLRDDRGHTVLTLVAAAENYQMFNLLLQAGASTDGLESIQLIQAATIGNLDRVQSLLSARVNLDLDRGAAIGNAAAAGHTQIVDLLIRAGANVNLSNNSGFTPIASAAHAGYGEIVQLLINAGADIQAPAGAINSYSALEYAQMGMYQFVGAAQKDDREDRQHAEIVRMLEQLESR